jgi:ABC-type proline/glycine betaine transport system permease subunit
MNVIEKFSKRSFFILTCSFATIAGLIGVVGIRFLFALRGQLSDSQQALAGAIVLALVLLGMILTFLVMIYYDPKRRMA